MTKKNKLAEMVLRFINTNRECLGEWLSGSGGHRQHSRNCDRPAVWGKVDDYDYCEMHHVEFDGASDEQDPFAGSWNELYEEAVRVLAEEGESEFLEQLGADLQALEEEDPCPHPNERCTKCGAAAGERCPRMEKT